MISYGVRSNDQLLLYYGFVERDNADDQYEVRWASQPEGTGPPGPPSSPTSLGHLKSPTLASSGSKGQLQIVVAHVVARAWCQIRGLLELIDEALPGGVAPGRLKALQAAGLLDQVK